MARTRYARGAEMLRGLFGVMYVGGALVHLVYWASNRELYGEITEFILFGWYRDLWTDLVLPNLGVLLPLLALFELAVAAAILSRRGYAKLGLALGAAFNLGLAPLGFWWPTNVALALAHLALLRVEYPESAVTLVRSRSGGRASSSKAR
ncbi:MAG TPA: hypothetical protein VJ898_04335 [Natrialbaceae archaeon]|nr:hypothetical protein [Natrialbaceae archaeon]